jgi:hypothetical protein
MAERGAIRAASQRLDVARDETRGRPGRSMERHEDPEMSFESDVSSSSRAGWRRTIEGQVGRV